MTINKPQEGDVEQIMEQIRENIRRRRQELLPSGSTNSPSDAQVVADLASLHSSYGISYIPFTSSRKIVGPLIVFVKKIIWRLLTPILTRQVAYNAANTRVATYLKEQLEALSRQQTQFQEVLASQTQTLQTIREQLEALSRQQTQFQEVLASQTQTLQTIREQTSEGERI
ncbi:MAG: hypothetical protein HY731_09895 [Candidatus Tectomicrobia bacterium]|nr:hypothetical protein [Candidatus Tectomicrobia bacterium]